MGLRASLFGYRAAFAAGLCVSLLLLALAGTGIFLFDGAWGDGGVLLAGAALGAAVLLAVVCVTMIVALDRYQAQGVLYRFAFRSSPDAMVLTRLSDGHYVEVNKSFLVLSGYSRRDLVGHSALEVGIWVDPRDRDRVLAEILRAGWVRDVEADFRRKDGRIVCGQISASIMRMRGEQHALSIVRDVTARREAETRLRQTMDELVASNTELMRFAHAAAHDLQQPLRSIVSYSQLLRRHVHGALPPEAQEDLGYLVEAAWRMHLLINGLIDYSRLSVSSQPFRRVEPGYVVTAALDSLRETVGRAGAEVTVGELPAVRADELQLLQVFENLLSNAVKFRAPDRLCHVRVAAGAEAVHMAGGKVSVPQGFAVFAVTDNGIGIAEEHRESVFEIFNRLHTQREYPGTGVGLSLCRRIVERHGGRIWIVPQAQGMAALFTLPLDTEAAESGEGGPSRDLRAHRPPHAIP